jgi:Serine dehydrogenase proteinase
MGYANRSAIYKQIEKTRKTKLIAFVTSDRVGMETQIAPDCIDIFVNLLDAIGPTKRISLLLHTNGGDTLAAWRLVNLIRTFCDEFEVLIPMKAMSAGTLISIGSDKIVMTKQAALGPIDPSLNSPLNPQVMFGNQPKQVPVSVEAVRGYLDAVAEMKIVGQQYRTQILLDLSQKVHPLVLGAIFRSRSQIKYLADKLIRPQVKDAKKRASIINFLSSESGSHDYTMNRREALELGLAIEKPSEEFYKLLRKVHLDYVEEMMLLQPYSQSKVVGGAEVGTQVSYKEVRGLVESVDGGTYAFVSEGIMQKAHVQTPMGLQVGLQDERTFEGWAKQP